MKHIGWCLDRIQIVIYDLPNAVISQKDKEKANSVIDEVQKYAKTLAQLVQNPDLKSRLHQLDTSNERIRLLSHEVEELFKDLEQMLYLLDRYIKDLREIILNRPEQWYYQKDQLIRRIDEKFGAEKGELRKLFQLTLHTKEDLQRIVTSEEHLAEFLK